MPDAMPTELGELIDATPWVDTHEHLVEEHRRLQPGGYTFTPASTGRPGTIAADWTALIDFYSLPDLVLAGLPAAAADELHRSERSPREQWETVEPFFAAARNTGFLHAVDITTERLFGLRLSRETVEEIDARARALRVEGYYAHVLRDVANVACCHVNTAEDDPYCETRQPDLLLQDLALAPLATGRHPSVERANGIDVGSLDDYLRVVERCFERYAGRAVAAKLAWAYQRSLAVEVPAEPPRREFERLRAGSAEPAERRRVEDFLLQRCIDLATDAGLPVKIHLGHLGGVGHPSYRHVFDHVRDVVPLVQANPSTTFVLMHIAWPQQEQLLALAKHQPNVVIDLCWAWINAPLSTQELLARALTTLPASKLLCFGGDYVTVEHVVGHAELARRGLQRALESLVACGWLTAAHAAELVPLLMHGNAERIFPPR
jgi:predicted TIM-barrel fold metal-dependent hydrolase